MVHRAQNTASLLIWGKLSCWRTHKTTSQLFIIWKVYFNRMVCLTAVVKFRTKCIQFEFIHYQDTCKMYFDTSYTGKEHSERADLRQGSSLPQTNKSTENIISLLEITNCEPVCLSQSFPGTHRTNPLRDMSYLQQSRHAITKPLSR